MDVIIYGATGGIGRALCKEFDKIGVRLYLIGRSANKLNQLRSELKQNYHKSYQCNSLDNEDDLNAIQTYLRKLGVKLDIGIYAAGQGLAKKIEATTLCEWREIIEANLTSAFLFSKLFLATSHNSPFELVFFGSRSTQQVWPKNGAYGASKAGLEYFTKVLQEEIGIEGGRVWLYQAGSVNTGFFRNIKNHLPTHKMIQPEALAKMVIANLATDHTLFSPVIPVCSV